MKTSRSVANKNTRSFLNRLCHCAIPRRAALALVVLACGNFAFGGAIHDAARAGDAQTIRALLKDNPDLVSSQDDNGYTPLHWAAKEGHRDVATSLLASKADVNAKDIFGYTPLHWAAQHDDKDLTELLLASKADVNIYDAALLGDVEMVKALLKANPDLVFSKDSDGATVLALAAYHNHKDLVEWLLANKANVNARDNQGATPLHGAAVKGYKDIAGLLLASKADVNAKANDGSTPLHFAVCACSGDNKGVVELLLANKADVNAKDKDGTTPLHDAAIMDCENVAISLLANKADVSAKDKYGRTPLQMAVLSGHKGSVELLRQHGAKE